MTHKVTLSVSNRRCQEKFRVWIEADTRRQAMREAIALMRDELDNCKSSFGRCVMRCSCMTYKE